jgi:hypothetical protein
MRYGLFRTPYDIAASLTDSRLNLTLEDRITEGMVEHRIAANKGERFQNKEGWFSVFLWGSTRRNNTGCRIIPEGKVPVALGVPEFPDDTDGGEGHRRTMVR